MRMTPAAGLGLVVLGFGGLGVGIHEFVHEPHQEHLKQLDDQAVKIDAEIESDVDFGDTTINAIWNWAATGEGAKWLEQQFAIKLTNEDQATFLKDQQEALKKGGLLFYDKKDLDENEVPKQKLSYLRLQQIYVDKCLCDVNQKLIERYITENSDSEITKKYQAFQVAMANPKLTPLERFNKLYASGAKSLSDMIEDLKNPPYQKDFILVDPLKLLELAAKPPRQATAFEVKNAK